MSNFNYDKLKKRIIEKYGSFSAFADAADCTGANVSFKLSGRSQFSQKNIVHWCRLLGISKKDIPAYFFTSKVK